MRQRADAVRPAEPGRERGDRASHHIHIRVARRHHPPRGFGLDAGRFGIETAGLLDAAPCATKRAKLRERQKLIGVRGETEGDQAPRLVEGNPRLAKRPEKRDAGRERICEFVARRASRGMDASRVGGEQRTRVALRAERARSVQERLRVAAPVGGKWPESRRREGIEAEGDVAVGGKGARTLDDGGESVGFGRPVGAKIKLEARAEIKAHALERRMQSCGVRLREAKSIRADRAGEHDLKSVGAPRQIVERLGVGLAGVRTVEAPDDLPGAVDSERPRSFAWRIKRLYADALLCLARELVEARPF